MPGREGPGRAYSQQSSKHGALRCSAAGVQVRAALPDAQQAYARLQREGRLWANVFAHALEEGKYEVSLRLAWPGLGEGHP